jgi:hypothetical protein
MTRVSVASRAWLEGAQVKADLYSLVDSCESTGPFSTFFAFSSLDTFTGGNRVHLFSIAVKSRCLLDRYEAWTGHVEPSRSLVVRVS